MKEFIIYAEGICFMSVCVHKKMSHEEINQKANLNRPTGISSKWEISKEKTFKDGSLNPCQCDMHEDRMHYLMSC